MTQLKEVYKCEICGNIIEVIHTGIGELVCCNKPMILQKEQSEGEYAEKHAPVIEKDSEGVIVKVGSVEHPMEEKHYIEWIEISTDKGASKKFLKPGEKPQASFPVKAEIKKARMYCNIHGLWRNK
jgi:superoxide reductase